MSDYVIVVLSDAFLQKNWPVRELNAALNIEASTGKVKVLPLLVGGEDSKQRIFARYPLLNDKLYKVWSGSVDPIMEALKIRLKKTSSSEASEVVDISPKKKARIVSMPSIKKEFSQLDKDRFVKKAFAEIKGYFQDGLEQLEKQFDEVDAEFTELSKVSFTGTVYVRGAKGCECKIWISKPNTMGYFDGPLFGYGSSESFNEIVNVMEEGNELKLSFSLGYIGVTTHDKSYTPEQAAEALWKRFTSKLEYQAKLMI